LIFVLNNLGKTGGLLFYAMLLKFDSPGYVHFYLHMLHATIGYWSC